MIRDPAQAALAHALLEYAGIGLGMWLYRRARRRDGQAPITAGGGFALLVGLLLGAGLGNKLVFALERPDLIAAWWAGAPLVLGQSIVGGLLGGLVGIELAKAATGQRASTGDLMVSPIVCGLMLGRVGCFLAGLHDDTHGLPTGLPWGVDPGDGVPRHPSALYEIAFLAALGAALHHQRARWAPVPGLRFKAFLAAYLLWRLVGDGLKPVRVDYPLGLSGIQWVCGLALLAYAPLLVRAAARLPRSRP